MNRERAKELLPIIKAFSEGKAIQMAEDSKWMDVCEDELYEYYRYRIKPEINTISNGPKLPELPVGHSYYVNPEGLTPENFEPHLGWRPITNLELKYFHTIFNIDDFEICWNQEWVTLLDEDARGDRNVVNETSPLRTKLPFPTLKSQDVPKISKNYLDERKCVWLRPSDGSFTAMVILYDAHQVTLIREVGFCDVTYRELMTERYLISEDKEKWDHCFETQQFLCYPE